MTADKTIFKISDAANKIYLNLKDHVPGLLPASKADVYFSRPCIDLEYHIETAHRPFLALLPKQKALQKVAREASEYLDANIHLEVFSYKIRIRIGGNPLSEVSFLDSVGELSSGLTSHLSSPTESIQGVDITTVNSKAKIVCSKRCVEAGDFSQEN